MNKIWKIHLGDKIKEDEGGETCSTNDINDKWIKIWRELCVCSKMILKFAVKN